MFLCVCHLYLLAMLVIRKLLHVILNFNFKFFICVHGSGGPDQSGRPGSRGYLHSPSPSLRTQDVVVQQRPSIFQGKSVITSLM